MENSGEESLMYSDSYLLPKLQELHKADDIIDPEGPIPLLTLVEDFIEGATGTIEQGLKVALLESRKETLGFQIIEDAYAQLPPEIGSISSQMTSEILHGNDTHSITLNVLSHLSEFKWDDKAGLTLAAFALTFGDLWLLVRMYAENVCNEPMASDQQRELTSTNKEAYRNQIEANNEFMKMLVYTLRYLFDITIAFIPSDRCQIYVYWIVRCAIAAATQIIVLSSRGFDQYLVGIRTPIEVEKLKSINGDLIGVLSKKEECERAVESYDTRLLSYPVDDSIDFMRIIVTDKDMPPLYHGETKRKDHLNVLEGKRVLLLISEIDIPSEDIASLKHVIIDTKKDEIVWIPVINRSITDLDPMNNQLEILQNSMPWYSVQPSMVTDVVIDFFKIEWKLKPKVLLYLLSPSGEVLRYDAIDMVRIWPNLSVDNLTDDDMEQQMWKKETWNLKLLVNDIIDPIIQQWIQDEKYIILYGGNDIDWIRRFIRQAHSVNSILSEQLSHCLPESSMVYFWKRFDSMFQSKRAFEYGRVDDILLQEMLRFRNHENWALLARGLTILVNGSGQIALNALEDMEKWRTKLLQS